MYQCHVGMTTLTVYAGEVLGLWGIVHNPTA